MLGQGDKGKRVGIWVRVSTQDQVDGESPENHEKRGRAYADLKEWEVVQVYRLEAVSGKAVMHHPEAKRMLADVRDGTITGLVFSKLARLARNTKELLEFAEIFRACGADLISLGESIDTSSPAGRLFFTMISAVAQWEREEIVSRITASVPARAALGKSLGGAAPFGYRYENKMLLVDPEEAPVRALVYELFAEHQRKKVVARILNERGYRTRAGAKFTDTSIMRILEDPTAKGLRRVNYSRLEGKVRSIKPQSEWVHVPVEAIVSEELWDRCAGIVARQSAAHQRPAKKTAHLFAGYAHCVCGHKMYVWQQSPKYICQNCRNKIPIQDLEAVFRSELTRFLISPDEIAAHEEAARDTIRERENLIEAGRQELAKIESECDRLFDLYSAHAISKDDFGRKHRPLSDRRSQLEDEMPRLQAEIDVLRINLLSRQEAREEAKDLSVRWDNMQFEERRQVVEAITDSIVIGKEEVEINLLHVPCGTDGGMATQRDG